MNLEELKSNLNSDQFHQKLTAVKALQTHPTEVALPLLLDIKEDEQFLIRSLVAMGLGKQQSPESFDTLREMMENDQDHNVRAEAANSLSLFGEKSIPYLRKTFEEDNNWLVRISILAALMDLHSFSAIIEVCLLGIEGEDWSVKQSCITYLGCLVGTEKETEALETIIKLSEDSDWQTRVQIVEPLSNFSQLQAQQTLAKLRQDSDHRVVACVLNHNIANN